LENGVEQVDPLGARAAWMGTSFSRPHVELIAAIPTIDRAAAVPED